VGIEGVKLENMLCCPEILLGALDFVKEMKRFMIEGENVQLITRRNATAADLEAMA